MAFNRFNGPDEVMEAAQRRGAHNIIQELTGLKLKITGREATCCCPFHDDSHPSMSIRYDGLYKCHGCGATGNLYTFIRDYMNERHPRELLARYLGVNLNRYKKGGR